MEKAFHEKLIRNTAFNTLGSVWNTLLAFLLTPYIIHRLGVERFGVWVLMEIPVAYTRLLDIGVVHYFSQFIARNYSRKDSAGLNKVVNTGFFFYIIFGILLFAVGYFLIPPLMHLCRIPPELFKEARLIFTLTLLVASFANLQGAFTAVLVGLQRMDAANFLAVAVSLITVLGTVYSLQNGLGLTGLAVTNLIVFLFSTILTAITARRIFPDLRITPFFAQKKMLRELLKSGSKVQVIRIGNVIMTQVDKIIISHFLNMSALSFYQLANSTVAKAKELPSLLVSAIVPFASELDALEDNKRLYELYSRGTKYLIFSGMPLFVFIFLNAHAIFYFWMGQYMLETIHILQILSLALAINILPIVGQQIALGVGKPHMQMHATILQTLVTLVLGVVLVKTLGLLGFVIAACAGMTLGVIWFTVSFHRQMRYGFSILRKIVFPAITACLFSAIFMRLTGYFLSLNPEPSSRMAALALLISNLILFLAPYLFIISKQGLLDAYDRMLLAKNLKKLGKIFGLQKDLP